MLKKWEFLDETIKKDAEKILDELGLDIETIVKITLKKIIREKSILFLLSESQKTNYSTPIETSTNENYDTTIRMTKNRAIALFSNNNITFSGNITFASKNTAGDFYWANPDFSIIDNQWNLILNDWETKEMHLFVIPQNSIRYSDLVCRTDKKNLIDLQIMYGDKSFTDRRSKISFSKYLVKSLKY